MRLVKIVRVQAGMRQSVEELLTEEVALKLYAGPLRIATLMCSPADLEDLIRGFLYSLRVIDRPEELRAVTINRATWSAFLELDPAVGEPPVLSGIVGSGCGSLPPLDEQERLVPLAPDGLRIAASRVSALMADFVKRSEVHRKTGGVHGAALAEQEIRIFREDIGRHNAVDKVIGRRLAEGGGFSRCLLLSSGRLTSEVLLKVARCGIPVVVSRAAPTDRSVELARALNITLLGFARSERMNLYSAPDRIL